MTGLIRIPVKFAGFSSAYEGAKLLFDGKLPADERIWSSSSHMPQMIYFLFDAEYVVEQVRAVQVSSDQTSHKFKWNIRLWGPDGKRTEEPVAYDENRNTGRGGPGEFGFSVDNDAEAFPIHDGYRAERESLPRLALKLTEPERAIGGQMMMCGHGWFRCVDLEFRGTRRKAANAKIWLEHEQWIRSEVGEAKCWTR